MKSRDCVFINANISNGTGAPCFATGLLVVDGIIDKLGNDVEVLKAASPSTPVIDCEGKSLLPGLIDAHNHMTLLGAALRAPSFHYPKVSSVADIVATVKEAAATKMPGQWIRGWGMDYAKFSDGRVPTRWDLDEVSPDNPVCIVHYTGHYVLVNSKALEMAGVDDGVENPIGGEFIRSKDGRVTGMAKDAAQQLVVPTSVHVAHHGPDIGYDTPDDELIDDIACASEALLKVGVTTVVDPQVTTREMTGLVKANRIGKLGVRTIAMFLSNHLDAVLELGIVGEVGDNMLAIGPIKYYCDGSIVGGTAAFTEPLINRDDNFCGSEYWPSEEQLCEALNRTHQSGLQFGIHTQGDKAHQIVIDCVERFLEETPRDNHRHRLEHSGYPRRDQVERMASSGLIPITQPGQLYEAGDNLHANYGKDRASRIYPMRDFLDNGIPAVISSDAFVQSHNPLSSIRGAVERKSLAGQDMGVNQRISLDEAIVCHTYNAAFSFFWEDRIGSLQPGKIADIVLFDCNLNEIAPKDLIEVKVALTMLGGEIVYQKDTVISE